MTAPLFSTPLNDTELEKFAKTFLNHMIEVLSKTNPGLAENIQHQYDNHLSLMMNMLKENSPNLIIGKMKDNQFVANMAMSLNLGLELKLKLESNKALAEAFKLLCEKNQMTDIKMLNALVEKLKLDPTQLQHLLTPQLLNDIKQLLMEVSVNTLKNDPSILNDKKMKPPAQGNIKEETPDAYSNLLGLITSQNTGSIPVVVQVYLGNGLAIPDLSPNYDQEMAHIGDINKVVDLFGGGDSLGLEASAKENFKAFASNLSESPLVDTLMSVMTSPSLTRQRE